MPLIQTAGLFAAGLLTTSGLFTGAVPGATTDDGPRVPCGAGWSQLPEYLQEDLRAVRDLPAGEKAAALREIRGDALDGDYGDRVQRFAERRDERIRALRRALPDEMKTDCARPATHRRGPARRLSRIRTGALAGEYGDRVQEVAVKVQERREACGRLITADVMGVTVRTADSMTSLSARLTPCLLVWTSPPRCATRSRRRLHLRPGGRGDRRGGAPGARSQRDPPRAAAYDVGRAPRHPGRLFLLQTPVAVTTPTGPFPGSSTGSATPACSSRASARSPRGWTAGPTRRRSATSGSSPT